MKKLLIICLLIGFSAGSIYAQNKTIKGRVIDDRKETLPYVQILINDTIAAGRTDLNGFFQIDIPIAVNKILLSSIGLESASVELTDDCAELEIVMILRSTYCFITLKKADRLRMKRFKNLSQLHEEAIAKGLFKPNKVCYTREFIPQ